MNKCKPLECPIFKKLYEKTWDKFPCDEIYCHSCNGEGTWEEKAYPSGDTVKVLCLECNGEGWVEV